MMSAQSETQGWTSHRASLGRHIMRLLPVPRRSMQLRLTAVRTSVVSIGHRTLHGVVNRKRWTNSVVDAV